MKQHSKKILFIIVAALLLLIIINLNYIILLFCDDSIKVSKTDFNNYALLKDRAYVYMNPFEYIEDNLTELVFCSGWSFVETSQDNRDKKIQLILKGQENTFITRECDLLADDIHRREGWKTIPGTNNNFAIVFSTISLPADTYEIFVYVYENENAQGIASTGQSFKKEGVNLYEYPSVEICENINLDEITNLIDYGWITVEPVNSCVIVSGWCAIDSIKSEDTTYFLCFIGDNKNMVTIRQSNYCRADVADYLEDNIYMMSGFKGGLGNESLPDEKGEVYVVIEYEGNYYLSSPETYDISADN